MKPIAYILVFLSLSILNAQEKVFYYGLDRKVPIEEQEDKAIIKIHPAKDINSAKDFSDKFNLSAIKYKVERLDSRTFVVKSDKNDISDFIQINKNHPKVKSIYKYYILEDGTEKGLSDEILVKFKPGVSDHLISSIIKEYNLSLIHENRIYKRFRVPDNQNALHTANQLFEKGIAVFSYPNFYIKAEPLRHIPNDEYFDKQVTCHNTGQVFTPNGHYGNVDADIDAPEAWNITKGNSNIVIAVIDDGVVSNHSDLPNTRQIRLPGSNLGASTDNPPSDPDDPSPTDSEHGHGTSCAGVIAATMDNYKGIAGIAPESKIMPIRHQKNGPAQDNIFADAIYFATNNGANIISISWTTSSLPYDMPAQHAALQDAIDNGVFVVCAAGNNANHLVGSRGWVIFPANATIPGVITVGASERYDRQANYSPTSDLTLPPQYNQVIDVVAPSHKAYPCDITGETLEMWSLDLPGNSGSNPSLGNIGCLNPPPGEEWPNYGTADIDYLAYTGRFGGTSHAAPVVAGIAALVLSINPALTPLQVFDIIKNSANKVGGYSYDANGFSNEMGYGRVNAFNSVMNACPQFYTINWPLVNGENIEYQASNYIACNNEVQSGSNVEIHAGNEVRFLPGFQALSGSKLHAHIEGCGTVRIERKSKGGNIAEEYNESKVTRMETNVKIYPNPGNEWIYLEYNFENKKNGEFIIFDLAGKKIAHQLLNTGDKLTKINVEQLPMGIYICKIIADNEIIITEKLSIIK